MCAENPLPVLNHILVAVVDVLYFLVGILQDLSQPLAPAQLRQAKPSQPRPAAEVGRITHILYMHLQVGDHVFLDD